MKYVLVYNVDDYPDNGGGFQYEELRTPSELDARVNEICKDPRNELVMAGELREYKYKAIEVVTKMVRDE